MSKTIKAGTYTFDTSKAPFTDNEFPTATATKHIVSLDFVSQGITFASMGVSVAPGGEFHFAYGKPTADITDNTYENTDVASENVISLVNTEVFSGPNWGNGYKTIVLSTDQSVSDEFYTWFTANIQKTLKQSVEQHITDAYEAINNKSGTIPTQKNLANLAGAIDSISSGTDTSDATATSADILKDKTAYVASGKVTGTVETYNGETANVPITDLTGHQWVGNNDIPVGNMIDGTFYVNFVCDNANYTRIYIEAADYEIKYTTVTGSEFAVFYVSWRDQKYRTIAFTGGTDATNATLIEWLQTNGTLI